MTHFFQPEIATVQLSEQDFLTLRACMQDRLRDNGHDSNHIARTMEHANHDGYSRISGCDRALIMRSLLAHGAYNGERYFSPDNDEWVILQLRSFELVTEQDTLEYFEQSDEEWNQVEGALYRLSQTISQSSRQ